jgi:hypothetical protein
LSASERPGCHRRGNTSAAPVVSGIKGPTLDEADLYIAPWTILAGLGAVDRRDMCDLLASFETTLTTNSSGLHTMR